MIILLPQSNFSLLNDYSLTVNKLTPSWRFTLLGENEWEGIRVSNPSCACGFSHQTFGVWNLVEGEKPGETFARGKKKVSQHVMGKFILSWHQPLFSHLSRSPFLYYFLWGTLRMGKAILSYNLHSHLKVQVLILSLGSLVPKSDWGTHLRPLDCPWLWTPCGHLPELSEIMPVNINGKPLNLENGVLCWGGWGKKSNQIMC